MTSSGALPGMSGFRLVEDHGIAQRFDAVDAHGRPVTLVILGDQAAADPRLRELFATHAAQASTAALPGELQVTFDSAVDRPWAASYQQPGSVGAERLLPGFLAAAAHWAPPPLAGPPPAVAMDPSGRPWQQPVWGAPAGWPPPEEQRSKGPLITVIALLVVLVVAGGVLVAFLAADDGDDDPEPVAAPGISDELVPPDLGFDLPPLEPPNKLEGPAPELKRDVPDASIVGPNWGPGDTTQTLAFDGWPFAFRAPEDWACIVSGYDRTPDAYVFRCVSAVDPLGQFANIFLRKCPTTCTPDEQASMNRDWLDEPERAVPAGPNTVYVETPVNDRGFYAVDSSHFFAEAPGGPLHWQVGVYVQAPPEDKTNVLKMMNDIRSQTP